jgi:hypothetical protein
MYFDSIYNVQSIALYAFPAAVFMVVFFVGLGYHHFRTRDADKRMTEIERGYPDGIEERNAPYPLVLILIIAGTVLWAVFYVMAYGLSGVKI